MRIRSLFFVVICCFLSHISFSQEIGEPLNQEFRVELHSGKIQSFGEKENLPFDVPFVFVGQVPKGVSAVKVYYVEKELMTKEYFNKRQGNFYKGLIASIYAEKVDSVFWYYPPNPLIPLNKDTTDTELVDFRLPIGPLNPNVEYVFQFDVAYNLKGKFLTETVELIEAEISEKIIKDFLQSGYAYEFDYAILDGRHFDGDLLDSIVSQINDSLPDIRLNNPSKLSDLSKKIISAFNTKGDASYYESKEQFYRCFDGIFSQISENIIDKIREDILSYYHDVYFYPDNLTILHALCQDIVYKKLYEMKDDEDLKKKIYRLFFKGVPEEEDFNNSFKFLDSLPDKLVNINDIYATDLVTFFNKVIFDFQNIYTFNEPVALQTDYLRIVSENSDLSPKEIEKKVEQALKKPKSESCLLGLIDSTFFRHLLYEENIAHDLKNDVQDFLLLERYGSFIHQSYDGKSGFEFSSYSASYSGTIGQAVMEGRYRLSEDSLRLPPKIRINEFADLKESTLNQYIENLKYLDNKIITIIDRLRAETRKKLTLSKTELNLIFSRLYILSDAVKTNIHLYSTLKSGLKNMNNEIASSIEEIALDANQVFNQGVTSHSIGNYKTRTEWYISGDIGIAHTFLGSNVKTNNLWQPYFGVNFNLAPVNRQKPFNIFKDFNQRRVRHFSAILGLTINSFNQLEQNNEIQPLWKNNISLLTGMGVRVFDPVRFNMGVVWMRQNDLNPLINRPANRAFPFISLSYDLDVIDQLGKVGKFFKAFNL